MDNFRHRLGTGVISALVLGLITVSPAVAQDGKEVAKSLCRALKGGEVRQAMGVKMDTHQDLYACYWRTIDIGDPERGVTLLWHTMPFDELQAVLTDALPVAIGGRPALYDAQQATLDIGLDQGVLVLTATDLQGMDWQAALTQLGELAVSRAADLVAPPPADPELLALLPTSVGGEDLSVTVSYIDREYPARDEWVGDAFRKALKAAGKKPADVSALSAGVPGTLTGVGALQVDGADATAFAAPVLTRMLGQEWTAVPETFVDGGVNTVTDATGQITAYLYPKDDIVWYVNAPEAMLGELLAALPGAPDVTTSAAPPEEPTGETPANAVGSDVDVEAILPSTVAGQELMSQSGEVGGFLQGKALRLLGKALDVTGKQQDDITYTIASAPDQSVAIVAFDVDGADASAFHEFMLETVLSGLPSRKHTLEQGEIAGKAVTIIHPKGAKQDEALYVFVTGDVIWMVGAKEPALTELLTAIP
jgi:hypothetical protein